MVKYEILHYLYKLNAHIGHRVIRNTTSLNFYLIGKRFDFIIIDLEKSFLFLKKAIQFLTRLCKNNGHLLFYHSLFFNLEMVYKCLFISLSKRTLQGLITYKWVPSLITNFFFSFYELMVDVTHIWLREYNIKFVNKKKLLDDYENLNLNRLIFEGSKPTEEVYYSYKDDYLLKKFKFNNSKEDLDEFGYRKHSQIFFPLKLFFKEWKKKMIPYSVWRYRQNAMKHYAFLRKFCLSQMSSIWKRTHLFKFRLLFLQMYFYLEEKKEDPFFWNKKKDYISFYDAIHRKFIPFWRLLLYFKYLNTLFNIPDALFCVFPDLNDIPIREYNSTSNELVSIGLVDTNFTPERVQYPIISNDDSIVLAFFYTSLFFNIFWENRVLLYTKLVGLTFKW